MAATATVGYGVGASLNVAHETTYGTLQPASDGVWLAWLSESLKRNRPMVIDETILGSLEVQNVEQGRRSSSGDVMQNVDGSNDTYFWNLYANNAGGDAYTVSSVASISAAPTLTAASGAGYAAGEYYGMVQGVVQRTSDGTLWHLSASAEANVTTTTGNLTIDWAWSNPTGLTLPEGYTYYGTNLWLTARNGAAGTESFCHFVAGTGDTYSDTNSGHVGTGVCPAGGPPQFAMKEHVWLPAYTANTNPQIPFSLHLIDDNNMATYFVGGRSTGVEYVVGAGNEIVRQKNSMSFRDWNTETNPSTSAVSNIRKFLSWASTIAVNGVFGEVIESFTLSGKMASEEVPGLSGLPRMRDIGYGTKMWELALNRGFEDASFIEYLNAGNSFSCQMFGSGQPAVLGCSSTDGNGNTAYPFAYSKVFDIPALVLGEAGGSVASKARIKEAIKATAQLDATAGYSLRSKHYNLTSTYAA